MGAPVHSALLRPLFTLLSIAELGHCERIDYTFMFKVRSSSSSSVICSLYDANKSQVGRQCAADVEVLYD